MIVFWCIRNWNPGIWTGNRYVCYRLLAQKLFCDVNMSIFPLASSQLPLAINSIHSQNFPSIQFISVAKCYLNNIRLGVCNMDAITKTHS